MNTVVITGTNKGIGLAAAKLFLEKGWRVIGTYRQELPPVHSEQFVPVELDLAIPASIENAAAEIASKTERVDALVNNAGISPDAQDKAPDLKKIRETFNVNVFGLIDFAERLLPTMGEGGHVVNLASRMGDWSVLEDGDSVGYHMSKAAVIMYTRSLAFRLKPRGIVVSGLIPGWVNTDMGNAYASGGNGPDREPADAAADLFTLITTQKETGRLWFEGKTYA